MSERRTIRINRAPVPTLWAAVAAERPGFDRPALTLGRAVAGSSARMKGQALGSHEPSDEPPSKAAEERRQKLEPGETIGVRLLGRAVPTIRTPEGVRALEKDLRPASASAVERCLESKFGDGLPEARAAMERPAASLPPEELERRGVSQFEFSAAYSITSSARARSEGGTARPSV